MRFRFILAAFAIVTLAGCATSPTKLPRSLNEQPRSPIKQLRSPIEQPHSPAEPPRMSAPKPRSCCRSVDLALSRTAIVQTAAKLVGATTVESNGRHIAYDCAGVTRAVFLKHGIDLYGGGSNDPHANGVRIIHAHIRQQGRFHKGPVAYPGDLIFFNNTWDYNGDGKVNDPLTHVGIVERQEPDGTVIFISRVAGAVERYHMNLGLPHVHKAADGRILNDYLRRKDAIDPSGTRYLTGELFARFATRVRN